MTTPTRRTVAGAAAASSASSAAPAPISESTGAPRPPTLEDVCETLHRVPVTAGRKRVARCETDIRDLMRAFERPEPGSGQVDVRDVGTIARGLNLCPTEATVLRMVEAAEEPESTGYVRCERLAPVLLRAAIDREFAGQVLEREDEHALRRALTALDPQRSGWIDAATFRDAVGRSGPEPLGVDELERLMAAVVDPGTGQVNVDDYITLLMET
jgi:Ca2+-binding EF-hand superfamily protein